MHAMLWSEIQLNAPTPLTIILYMLSLNTASVTGCYQYIQTVYVVKLLCPRTLVLKYCNIIYGRVAEFKYLERALTNS
jgi:hypothetical protein